MNRISVLFLVAAVACLGVSCGKGSSGGGGAGCSITSISPSSGNVNGSELVTLTGTGFTPQMEVIFGTSKALNVVVDPDGTTARASTPFSPVELTVDVTVILFSGQTCVLPDAYSYEGPCLAGGGCLGCLVIKIDPVAGPVEGGSTVTIIGAGFFDGAVVVFGTERTLDVPLVIDGSRIQAVAPLSPITGLVDVTVINPISSSVCTLEDAFTYGEGCAVTSVFPSPTCPFVSEEINVTGVDFQAGAVVNLLDDGSFALAAAEVDVVSDTLLRFLLPQPNLVVGGPFDVEVVNPDGRSCFLPRSLDFTVGINPPPGCDVSDMAPNSGPLSGGNAVVFTGTGFLPTDRVFFGIHEATSVTFNSGAELVVIVPPGSDLGTVTVTVIDDNCSRICFNGNPIYTYQ